ncbi:hypothetical protein [Undibacterium sp. TC9W]|uniref:hypothetical protein n=1 Tax=Undibacterium sp. TC9W TaxID=3413053 RepID=UPI003BF3B4D4
MKNKYTRHTLAFLILIIIFSYGIYYTFYLTAPKELPSNNIEKPALSLPAPSVKQNEYQSPVVSDNSLPEQGCDEKKVLHISSQKPIQSIAKSDGKISALVDDNFTDPTKLIQSAQAGDGAAAIAAYKIFASCFPLGDSKAAKIFEESKAESQQKSGCTAFPKDTLNDRLWLLDAASKKGDSSAKLTYAMNAIPLAQYYRTLGTNEATSYAADIIKKSEVYGAEAATGGIEEAYHFMVRAYQLGMFGSRNPLLAYAYALPIQKINPSDQSNEYVNSLSRNLSKNDIQIARQMAFGCPKKIDNSITVNPFTSQI